ncbi:CHAT domain-containing protein [Ephemerocybe angulata]|uniref:CHAT domain-containing protein n=1 Tax=Ephemerocybe angulata TaxID=980116 RepID=A0A8H6I835_9AGAR|nr:CHAT domain-containing protein [Tulosesus angulatus]
MCIYWTYVDILVQLNARGVALLSAFERTGHLSDITDSISVLQNAVDLTPQGHTDLPVYHNNLGISFMRRSERTGQLADIADAISVLQKAVDITPQGHANLPRCLNNLGHSFMRRFERTGELTDITNAILAQQKAVDLTPQGHPDLPSLLNNLGTSFMRRFERGGELADIVVAILVQQKAVDLTPQGHFNLPHRLTNLGNSFTCRFKHTGELADIADAIAVQQKAVDLIPPGHADLPGHLNDLGVSLMRRFGRTGELVDIADAISVQQKAVDLTPQGDAGLPMHLNNLGNSFSCRFKRTGELEDIADAIAVQQKAVNLIPRGHAGLPMYLNNLGNSFTSRFERTGELADIADAILVQQKAVDLTPQGHADLPMYLNNLGNSFIRRFKHTGELVDIADAISLQQKAVDLTPSGHAGLPMYLSNLGNSFTCRFERTGELADIVDAIAVQKQATDLIPQGHAGLPMYLNNLGNSFLLQFERTGELVNIADAISMQQQAVDLTPQGHADLPGYLNNLGRSFYGRFTSSGEIGDLEKSMSCYKVAATSTIGSPRVKLAAAKRWASLVIQHHSHPPEIILAFDTALGLVALIAGLEQTVRGRYTQLEDISGLALKAAAAACALDRADKALEWLEQGRCLQLEHAGSSRVQSTVGMSLSEKRSLEDEARAHLSLARKWDDLLKTARTIPGFESFLMPSPCLALMQHLPTSGPVIVVNIDEGRCDALALLAGLDQPLHIPLPNFSIQKASTYRVRPAPIGKRSEDLSVHRVLRCLFEVVVKPVLDTLGFSDQVPPRLWWCPTGALSFLPLHAAGIYRGPNQESVSDYAVSSYTPTITALTDRVKNNHLIDSTASGLFLTSQPSVSDAPPIPGTTKEVSFIYERAKESGVDAVKLEGDDMTVAQCLEHMQAFSCIHLACHGSQNAAEPLKSRFLFHNGSLELGTILKSKLKHADLAFLSACQTSTGKETLSDEAVHLAAGMLAAGYRRVVGTMWSIGDKAGQDVATSFYEYLFTRRGENTVGTFDGTHSAVALHHATQTLRLSLDDSERSLLTWIPFVHFGL